MSRIFISYKRADKEKVFKIKDKIEAALHEKCWIDLDGIESDAQFVNVIINAIDEADIFLFMFSAAHAEIVDYENDWTIRELNYAKEEKKTIYFINIDDTQLTKWFKFMFPKKQQVNATSPAAVQKLCNDLEARLFPERIAERERQRKEAVKEEERRRHSEAEEKPKREEAKKVNVTETKSPAPQEKKDSAEKSDTDDAISSIIVGILFLATPWLLSFWGYTYGAEQYVKYGPENTPWYKITVANLSFYLGIISIFWTMLMYTIQSAKAERKAFWIVVALIIAMFGCSVIRTPYYTPAYYSVLWGL